MATSTMDEAIAIDLSDELVPCDICGRTFLPTPLKKHLVVCERNATRKRKVFDSLKQRVHGTDLAPFVENQRNVPKCGSQTSLTAPVNVAARAPAFAAVASPPVTISISANEPDEQHNHSKEKPDEMVDRMRPTTKAPKKTSPRRSLTSVGKMGVTERCPHCERQFGVKAFDRHVEWCKEHKTRIVRSPASVVQAKERLEARTKYRVPPLNKSKRSVTREKYAPGTTGGMDRAESQISVDSASSVDLAKKPQKLAVNEPQLENIRRMPTTENNKSPRMKHLPFTKINNEEVNKGEYGLTVSQVLISDNTPRHLTGDTDRTINTQESKCNITKMTLSCDLIGDEIRDSHKKPAEKKPTTLPPPSNKTAAKKIKPELKPAKTIKSKRTFSLNPRQLAKIEETLNTTLVKDNTKQKSKIPVTSKSLPFMRNLDTKITDELDMNDSELDLDDPKFEIILKTNDEFPLKSVENKLNLPVVQEKSSCEIVTIMGPEKNVFELDSAYSEIEMTSNHCLKETLSNGTIVYTNKHGLKSNQDERTKAVSFDIESKSDESENDINLPSIPCSIDKDDVDLDLDQNECDLYNEDDEINFEEDLNPDDECDLDSKNDEVNFEEDSNQNECDLYDENDAVYFDADLNKDKCENIPTAPPIMKSISFEIDFKSDFSSPTDETVQFNNSDNLNRSENEPAGNVENDELTNNNTNLLNYVSDAIQTIETNDIDLNPILSRYQFGSASITNLNKCMIDTTTNSVDNNTKTGVWELDFLNSLKSKSNESQLFQESIKNKYSSTPIQETTQSLVDESDSFSIVRSRQHSPESRNISGSTPILSNLNDVNKTNIKLPDLPELPEIESDSEYTTNCQIIQSDSSILHKDEIKHECDLTDLNNFIKEGIAHNLEVEMIVSENCDESSLPTLNLFQTNTHEMVLSGKNCFATFNQLLERNEIKNLSLIFVNEDYIKSPNIKTSEHKFIQTETTIATTVAEKREKITKKIPKKLSYLKYLKRRRKSKIYIPGDHLDEDDPILDELPFIENELDHKQKRDTFWDKYVEPSETTTNVYIAETTQHEKLSKKKSKKKSKLSPKMSFSSIKSGVKFKISPNKSNSPKSSSPRLKLPLINTPCSNSKLKEDYDPFIVAEKQLLELLQCDDFKPLNNAYPLTAPTSRPSTNSSSKKLNSKPIKTTPIKRASVIEPPLDFSDKMSNLQDNFEFIENFINDNYIPPDKLKEAKSKKELKQNGLCLNSIFSERKYSDDLTMIDPSLINENDNLTIPHKLLVDNYSPDHYSVQYDKKIAVLEPIVLAKTETLKRSLSLQNEQSFDDIDDLISSFDDDESFPTLKSFLQSTKTDSTTPKQIQRSTLSLNSSIGRVKSPKKSPDSKRSLPALNRSVSLINPVIKARSMKNKQDIQDYLHVSDTKTKKTTDKHKKDSSKISEEDEEEIYPKDHAMYEEYKKYEKEYRMEEQRKNSGSGDLEVNNYEEPSYELKSKSTTKINADSAYGSLNRNSSQAVQPKLHTRHTISKHNSVERSPSPSGSETSITPVKLQPAIDQRMSKFCHECGTKYPLDTAKFCIECGVRRLVL